MVATTDAPHSGSDPCIEKSTEAGFQSDTSQTPSQLELQSNLLDLERLGRERPPCFANIWAELAFGFSIVMSQILAVCIFLTCPSYIP
jgi:hypothetical protein